MRRSRLGGRPSSAWQLTETAFIDVDELLSGYDPEKDIELQPLDTVVIPYVR